jgi:hypothetical protein
MTINADLIEVLSDGATKTWGIRTFIQLPAPGDRILAYRADHDAEEMDVLHVLHRPLPVDRDSGEPGATVYARFRLISRPA